MKKIYLPLIILLLHGSLFAQAIGDFQSHFSGDWSITSTWERWNGTTWINPAPNSPTNTDGTITILNGHTITVTTNVTIDQTIINSGGIVTLSSVTFTLSNGTGTDLTVNGTLNKATSTLAISVGQMVVNGTYKVTGTSGSTSFSTGNLTFNNLSIYEHARNGGTLPVETNTIWASNSTCLLSGVTNALPSNLNQTYGNFTYNCPSQGASTENLGTVFTTVNGNLSIISTGAGGLRFASTGDGTVQISGNYTQSGGKMIATTTGNRTINVNGNFSVTNGTFDFSENNTGNSTNLLNIKGNFLQSGGTITQSGTATSIISTIVFYGTTNQNYTGGGTISGTINFTINNPAGITLLTSATFPAGLTMTNGNIELNGFTLTLGTGATTATRGTLTWASGLITGNGTFTRWFSTASITLGNVLGLFPIGNSTNNRNVWIGGSPLIGGTISVQHNNLTGTTALSFIENSLSFDKRTNMGWTLSTANGFAGLSLALRIQGTGIPGINAVGDLNICLASGIAGGTYSAPGGSVTNPQVNRSGLTQTNLANTFYFASTSGSPLPVELSYFAVKSLRDGGAQLDWKTETEISNYGFEVYRSNQSDDWKLIGFVEGYGNSNSPKEYLFVDKNVSSGKYSYRLKQIDTDGNFTSSKAIEINFGLPAEFELSQNYPNPFNPVTTIKFSLPESGNTKLTIYNLLGEQVAEPVNEFKNAGVHTIIFNASELNSGVYIYKIESNGFVKSRKMTLIN